MAKAMRQMRRQFARRAVELQADELEDRADDGDIVHRQAAGAQALRRAVRMADRLCPKMPMLST